MNQQMNRKRQFHCVEGNVEGNNEIFFEPKFKRRRTFNNQFEGNLSIENLIRSVTIQFKNLNEQCLNLSMKINNIDRKIDNLNNRVNKIDKILKQNYIQELQKFPEPCSYIS
jgi:predicted RNase H-like nuclease (RuvC/YqgF family)